MLLINTGKEKLINAILYFCKHTRNLSETKLYKLLYHLDFLHFKETGRSVTDLEYYAWDFGPVPQKLFFEIKNRTASKDILNCITELKDEDTGKIKDIYFKTSQKPNLDAFSEREIEILKRVAEVFKHAKAKDMTEITHLKNLPWDKTIKAKGEKSKIDFFLSLDEDDKIDEETAQFRQEISQEMKKLFGKE